MAAAYWITPSKLELYRKFSEGAAFGAVTEQMVTAAIMGEGAGVKPALGAAFEALLELGPEKFYHSAWRQYIVKTQEMAQQVKFSPEQVAPAQLLRQQFPRMRYGLRYVATLRVGQYLVKMPMRLPGVNGLVVHEIKTQAGNFAFDNYERSCQWRAYLLATGASFAQYHVFNYLDPAAGLQSNQPAPPVSFDRTSFRLYPYAALESDLFDLTFAFIEFCHSLNLTKYLLR